MLHLVGGFAVGAALLAAKGLPWHLPAGLLVGAHRDLLLIGWLAQLTLGVAYWILPRWSAAPVRGPSAPVRLGGALLNAGVILAAAGRPAGVASAGHALALLGVSLVLASVLPRVRPGVRA